MPLPFPMMTHEMGVGYGIALEDVEAVLVKYVGPLNVIFLEFNALKAAHKGEPYEVPDRRLTDAVSVPGKPKCITDGCERPRREGQRSCSECHSRYMSKWRKQRVYVKREDVK